MALCTAGFEKGTNGATIAVADPGDPTAWDAVSIVAGGTLTYDNTRSAVGSQSSKIATAGTGGNVYLQWAAALGTVTDHYGRIYAYLTAAPAVNVMLVTVLQGGTTAAQILVAASTGKIQLLDSTLAQKGLSTAAIPFNQWIRVEYRVLHSATVGLIEAKIFTSPNSGTPAETVTTSANLNTLANGNGIRFGYTGAQPTVGPYWLDGILAGASAYPGPAAGAGQMLLLGVGA